MNFLSNKYQCKFNQKINRLRKLIIGEKITLYTKKNIYTKYCNSEIEENWYTNKWSNISVN